MSDKCGARTKLEQAQYFISQARKANPDQRDFLVNNFEAAVVFARSITLCLQKDFHDCPGFIDWYSKKQESMRQNPLSSLFVERRNYVLKEGSAGIRKNINVEICATIGMSAFATCKVTRARPWYRRSPKIIWEDIRASIEEPVREWNWKRKMRRNAKRKKQPSAAKVTEGFYFDDPVWNNRDIFDLFNEYLGQLELIVAEAERMFF